MKIQFCQIALLIATATLQSSPTLAESQRVEFYCGRTQNSEPSTMVAVKGNAEGNQTLVVWRTKFRNQSPRERCDSTYKRFQTAWNRGNFSRLAAAVEKGTGAGLVCAFALNQKVCQPKDILFAVNSKKEADNVIQQLWQSLKNRSVSQPIYQASSEQSIDMQELINSLNSSAEK